MKKKSFYFFIGTTAEFIKIAPVIKEFKSRKIPIKIITSGQNAILLKELEVFSSKVKVDISLHEKDQKSSIFYFALWAIKTYFLCIFSLRKEFQNKKTTYFIVHGDTVSSLLGALVAKSYGLNLVHIESGLRSFNFLEPFPEEICRYVISSLSDIHFCPNKWCSSNLKNKKGIKVITSQNTLIESCWTAVKSNKKPIFIPPKNHKYLILVIHRQEHVLFKKNETKKILKFILQNIPSGLNCVFIMHELTSNFLQEINQNTYTKNNIILTPRLPYEDFAKLLKHSEFIITDGGSNQEESYYLGKPCLVLRNRTERIEGLGENALLSKNNRNVIKKFLNNYKKYKRSIVKYDEKPSRIIVDYLQDL